MENEIRHRRLFAFFRSKVLNSMMMLVVTNLLLMAYTRGMILPVICGALSLLLFIGYSLWIWIGKPKTIIINNWLSNISCVFTLYFLIITTMDAPNQWWYITPITFAVVVFFMTLTNVTDQKFDI